jgi:hypothetical protein
LRWISKHWSVGPREKRTGNPTDVPRDHAYGIIKDSEMHILRLRTHIVLLSRLRTHITVKFKHIQTSAADLMTSWSLEITIYRVYMVATGHDPPV